MCSPTARRLAFVVAAAATVVAGASPLRAHDSLNRAIAVVSQQIIAHPSDAGLYLRRGELYRLAADWPAATIDYDQSERMDPSHAGIALCRAALALDAGDPAAAVGHADGFVATHPAHAEALLLRSRALYAAGRILDAVADLDRAIALLPEPRPEQFVERARWLAALQPPRYDEALRGLDAGIAQLGPLVSLESVASEIEISLERAGAARARRARIAAPAGPPRQRAARVALPGAAAVAATLTRGPYLQSATPSSAVIRWRTAPATDSRVAWGDAPGNLASVSADPALVTEHEVSITGLAANTRNYYAIGTSTETLAGGDAGHFVLTPPAAGTRQPVRIWILGDSGETGSVQIAVRDAYTGWTGARGTDVWLMLGDNAYNAGTDAEYQAALFTPYAAMLSHNVLWPTRGNHDQVYSGANNDYYDLFTLPASAQAGGVASGTEAYYSFDHANVHFVCLDSEGTSRSPTGPMAVWLRSDLTANHQDWTIAYWHHPPYTKGSHDSDNDSDSGGRMRDMRTHFVPLLDSLGVDVTLTGHSHSYERSYLLQGHYGPSSTLVPAMILGSGSGNPVVDGAYVKATLGPGFQQGIVHAVAGSSGHTSGGSLDHPAMFTSQNVAGSLVVDVDGSTLRARFLDSAGSVTDDFAIVKTGATDVAGAVRVDLRLDAARPNPFVTATHLAYSLPAPGTVRLTVHDAAGRRIAIVDAGERRAGRHAVTWDGHDTHGRRVAAGVYFARLQFAGQARLGKVVLSH